MEKAHVTGTLLRTGPEWEKDTYVVQLHGSGGGVAKVQCDRVFASDTHTDVLLLSREYTALYQKLGRHAITAPASCDDAGMKYQHHRTVSLLLGPYSIPKKAFVGCEMTILPHDTDAQPGDEPKPASRVRVLPVCHTTGGTLPRQYTRPDAHKHGAKRARWSKI
jgi:hypothetical protein